MVVRSATARWARATSFNGNGLINGRHEWAASPARAASASGREPAGTSEQARADRRDDVDAAGEEVAGAELDRVARAVTEHHQSTAGATSSNAARPIAPPTPSRAVVTRRCPRMAVTWLGQSASR